MNLISIDPGLKSMGWCRWDHGEPCEWGLVSGKDIRTSHWTLKSKLMAKRMFNVLEARFGLRDTIKVVSEIPAEHGGRKGRAALQSGAVRKLTYLVGLVGGYVCTWYGYESFLVVEPGRWKGQVPKEVTRKRMHRRYPVTKQEEDHNTIDAIGIGHWYLYKRR